MVEAFENVLLVAFVTVPPPSALKLWAAGFDEEPRGFQSPPQGPQTVEGVVQGYVVTLTSQNNRVDITLNGVAAAASKAPPPSLGELSKAIEFALERMAKISPNLKIGRAAIVLQGHTPTDTDKQAVDIVRGWLPKVAIPAEAGDFLYQVTVTRPSKVDPDRELGQLCRWQTGQIQVVEVPLGRAPVEPRTIQGTYAALLYVDVFGKRLQDLDAEAATAALNEVAERAKIIAEGGVVELG